MGRFCCAALIFAALAGGQDVVFRANVRLVQLLVTVKNQAGQLVGSLNKEDFQLFDNGVEQKIVTFQRRTEQPLSVSLMIDSSGSTAKDLKYELDASQRFFKALLSDGNEKDTASLYSFNWEVVQRSNFTRRLSRLDGAMKDIKAEAGTSLYDAIYFGAQGLEDREGRHVLVIVTDGADTTSAKSFHAALEAAQRADTVIYAILVRPITNDAGRSIGGENALAQFASGTGGQVFQPTVGPELDQAFSAILRDLRTQYLIAFNPTNVPPTKNRFHKLELKLKDPSLRAQTRNGYYGEADSSVNSSPDFRSPVRIP